MKGTQEPATHPTSNKLNDNWQLKHFFYLYLLKANYSYLDLDLCQLMNQVANVLYWYNKFSGLQDM